MFCGGKSDNRMNHLHERALRIVYNDNQSSFENLFRKDCSVSNHHRNIRSFAIKINIIKKKRQLLKCLNYLKNLNDNLHSQTDFLPMD